MVAIAGKQIPKWAVVLVLFLVAGFVIGGASRLFSSALESESDETTVWRVSEDWHTLYNRGFRKLWQDDIAPFMARSPGDLVSARRTRR